MFRDIKNDKSLPYHKSFPALDFPSISKTIRSKEDVAINRIHK